MLFKQRSVLRNIPASILYKSTAGRYRPVRVADGPITARYRFIKNASWDVTVRLNLEEEILMRNVKHLSK